MTSKKIWIVAFEFLPFPGGQATYAAEMARALARMGNDVTVIAPRYDNVKDDNESFQIKRVFKHQKLDLASILTICRALASVHAEDIVLAADIRSGIVTTLFRMLKPFTKIIMFHGGEVKRAQYSQLAKFLNRFSAMFAKKIVANSSYTAEQVKKYVGGEPCVTLLGVAPFWFEPAKDIFENETLRNLAAELPVICTVARLESRKGHLMAMQALRLVAERTKIDFRYIICGKAVYADYTAEVMKAVAAFPDKFLYVGPLSKDDLRRLYARSQIMILAAQDEPGFIEGFGLVITEAGAQKCPSISTRVGGIVDAVIDGKTGYLFAQDDIEGMAQSIELLLKNETKRLSLGEAAQNYAKSLSWEETAAKTLSGII